MPNEPNFRCNLYFQKAQINFLVNTTGTQKGAVNITYNGNTIAESSLTVSPGSTVTLDFTNNGNYYVSSITGCNTNTTLNSDGVSLKSAEITNIEEDTTCTVNYNYLYKWEQYRQVTTTTCAVATLYTMTNCCGRYDSESTVCHGACYQNTGTITTEYGYYTSCDFTTLATTCSCTYRGDTITTSAYYPATLTSYSSLGTYLYSFSSNTYGTSTSSSNPTSCGSYYCVKVN